MSEDISSSPPRAMKDLDRQRAPSGPRPRPPLPKVRSTAGFRINRTSTSSLAPDIIASPSTRPVKLSPALSALTDVSPLDALIDSEVDFTASPDDSPGGSRENLILSSSKTRNSPLPTGLVDHDTAQPKSAAVFEAPHPRIIRTDSPEHIASSQPIMGASNQVGALKVRPRPLRLDTNLVVPPTVKPTEKALSPSLQHWQQVRAHVLATPAEERPGRNKDKEKKYNLMSKAANRLGFRQVAENVIASTGGDKGKPSMTLLVDVGNLTQEEREDIARERRKFARDIRNCLDACSLEESKRRLSRSGRRAGNSLDPRARQIFKSEAGTGPVMGSSTSNPPTAPLSTAQTFGFDPEFSAFAPLLTEFARYLPSARAKKPWSRTCPHHSTILAELGVAFVEDGMTTDTERQQALEVFGLIVRNWAPENGEEELSRWTWLARALLIDDRQLRQRGLSLLTSFLRSDPVLPVGPDRPKQATAFVSLASALIKLLHAVETSAYGIPEHEAIVLELLDELVQGSIIAIDGDTISDILPAISELDSRSGIEQELLWLAAGNVLDNNARLSTWFLSTESDRLNNFAPPPILHATPPVILQLRSRSCATFLAALTGLVKRDPGDVALMAIWRSAQERILSDLDILTGDGNEDDTLAFSLGTFLLHLELQQHSPEVDVPAAEDPFRISMQRTSSSSNQFRDALTAYWTKGERWTRGISKAAKSLIVRGPLGRLTKMTRYFLSSSTLLPLGKECVDELFNRLVASPPERSEIQPFLTYLHASHPQLLYKPLFACSAASQALSLMPSLRLVRALATLLGQTRFWIEADPQMVAIILMGGTGPKLNKGKAKDDGKVLKTSNVKLGRYAVLLELIATFRSLEEGALSGTKLRAFVEPLEMRLAIILDAEEKGERLPIWYRTLICDLLREMRLRTASLKNMPWRPIIIRWATDLEDSQDILATSQADTEPDSPAQILTSLWNSLIASGSKQTEGPISGPATKAKARKRTTTLGNSKHIASAGSPDPLFDRALESALFELLVLTQAGLKHDDWLSLLPGLWRRLDTPQATPITAFLFMKCGEVTPSQVEAIVTADLAHTEVEIRISALLRLSKLYGWRYQLTSQKILTDRRGPVFLFPTKTLDYVATEIGSAIWLPPHDVQDAALQRFGPGLPIELRQRLMALGWTDDAAIATKSQWEQVPITSLPSLQQQDDVDGNPSGNSPSPVKPLVRRGSGGSGSANTTISTGRRKAIYAPILLTAFNQQSIHLVHDPNRDVVNAFVELNRLFQRDDPAMFVRSLTDDLQNDFAASIDRINSVSTVLMPGFAYSALNAIVGFLKGVLRSDPSYPGWPRALATIAILIPGVSGMSLRDIRKNKAEHVLLPASIHEDEGALKVHGPWQNNSFDIQAAQLLILLEILKANPREVYLIKKMLANLQIQASIPSLKFSRTWLLLIAQLFQTVNRNYNDRAELRHFLVNVAAILRYYGKSDPLVLSHAMRILMLCSARFRRLYISMGFSTTMAAVYEVYRGARSAGRDGIEYAMRSFYRIHSDVFVFQTCVTIAELDYDPKAVFDLLTCLSVGNTKSSGLASGLRGLNDIEEIDALVQMISGPEITIAEIGQSASARLETKMANISLDDNKLFPKENIIRLFITVIAADPTSARASRFSRLFAGMIPLLYDSSSQSKALLRDAIEALGALITKGKMSDDVVAPGFQFADDGIKGDWNTAKRDYILLVEAYTRSGGQLSSKTIKRVLQLLIELSKGQRLQAPGSVNLDIGTAASDIIREMAKTNLGGSRYIAFLRDVSPLFRSSVALIDYSGLYDEITALIKREQYDLAESTSALIIDSFIGPSMELLIEASKRRRIFSLPFRPALAALVGAALFIRGDPLFLLETQPANASLLAGVVIPLVFELESPDRVKFDKRLAGVWIRLLEYVIAPVRAPLDERGDVAEQLAHSCLCLQVIKTIVVRSADTISSHRGMWDYLARIIARMTEVGGIEWYHDQPQRPRIQDWMLWSFLEFICSHPTPLMIPFRSRIQTLLRASEDNSYHEPEISKFPRFASPNTSRIGESGVLSHSDGKTEIGIGLGIPIARHRSSSPSRLVRNSSPRPNPSIQIPPLSPQFSINSQSPNARSRPAPQTPKRPSFLDVSNRLISTSGLRTPESPRERSPSPSSSPFGQKVAQRVTSAISGNFPFGLGSSGLGLSPRSPSATVRAFDDASYPENRTDEGVLKSAVLIEDTKRAVGVVMRSFGHNSEEASSVSVDAAYERIPWSEHVALQHVTEQTRLLIDHEFKDVLRGSQGRDRHPSSDTLSQDESYARWGHGGDDSASGYTDVQIRSQSRTRYYNDNDDDAYAEDRSLHEYDHDEDDPSLPILSVSHAV